jgi:glycerol-3-phosphate acyltransferase PlsX
MTGDRGAIALDANGTDAGPSVIVDGARAAAADGIALRVFGRPDELAGLDGADGVEVVPAADAITNDDEPVRAVRSRPGASIVLAAGDVAEGRSSALVSAGSTGAAMTAALFALRRLPGVHRPALAVQVPVPSRDRPVVFLDVGANTEARPQHLVQFAYLGSAFAAAVLGIARPRVGLLTVGEEQGKGTPLVVQARAALDDAEGIEFAGNVEGRDLPAGTVDVVVADGFTGNVALKTMEGTASEVAGAVRGAAKSNPVSAVGGLLMRPALGGMRRRLDPDQTGGAILLGLRGVAVVAHGSSSADGIANAVRLAARAVSERAVERTAELLEASGARRSALRGSGERDAKN